MAPNIHDLLNEQRKHVQSKRRKEWRKEHAFEIIHAVLTSIAIIISVVALIVSVLALKVQLRSLEQSAQTESQQETIEAESSSRQN